MIKNKRNYNNENRTKYKYNCLQDKTRQDKTNFGCKTGACKKIIEFLKKKDDYFLNKENQIATYLESSSQMADHQEDAKNTWNEIKKIQNCLELKKMIDHIKVCINMFEQNK